MAAALGVSRMTVYRALDA
ncbi:hypothetical protein [Nioella aestuarii]